jgi:cyclic dehypoxanthinyl futalosine synthase
MPLSRAQALDCFLSDDLIGIGMEADAVRRRLHPEGVVSYCIEAAISIANRQPEAILADIATAEDRGATAILLHGASDEIQTLLGTIKQRHPKLWLTWGAAAQIPDPEGTLPRLHDHGLDSIGSLQPEVPTEDWLRVHRAAHRAGMTTVARIVFGAGETTSQRLTAFEAIHQLQSETGGFAAIAPVSFHAPGGRELDETTAVEFLKTLAIARMALDTIPNLQVDWTVQGLKALQMALRFGANDVGSPSGLATEEELRRLIRDAGFRPAQRELGFRALLLA